MKGQQLCNLQNQLFNINSNGFVVTEEFDEDSIGHLSMFISKKTMDTYLKTYE